MLLEESTTLEKRISCLYIVRYSTDAEREQDILGT